MRISKYEHALLIVEQSAAQLVIDPGSYSNLPELQNVVAVVFTHLHDDHTSQEHAQTISRNFPAVKMFGTQEVVEKLTGLDVQAVYHGDHYEVGPFQIDFYGDLHQVIHRSIPLVQNVGVMINSRLYYPGDSYTFPEQSVEILACPTSAPWLRISDVIDFLDLIRPKKCFATHNALLSEQGHALQNNRVQQIVEKHGGEFRYLNVGESWQL
ncbi:MAG: MBL fold metallo-hydrolase [Aquiluna sp.]|jgi:L-ascorbate metabolism protein UlaG (beta-lactamase superfamily)